MNQHSTAKNTSENRSIFSEKFLYFLKVVGPNFEHYTPGYKANSSCKSHYNYIKEAFEAIQDEIIDKYLCCPGADRKKFIEAYLKKMENAAGYYHRNKTEEAVSCLQQNNSKLEQLFSKDAAINPDPKTFPGFLFFNETVLKKKEADDKTLKCHNSFFSYIFSYFIDQLADFINGLADSSKKKRINSSEISFGFKGKPEELLNFLKKLHVKLSDNLVDEQQASVEALHSVLTADSIKSTAPKVYFSCQTTQLAYVFYLLEPLFENLKTYSIVGSERFYTSNKHPLTKTNLYKSKSSGKKDPKQRNIIDDAFISCFSKKE